MEALSRHFKNFKTCAKHQHKARLPKLHVTRIKRTVKHQDSPPKNTGTGQCAARNLEMLEDVLEKRGVHTTLQHGLSFGDRGIYPDFMVGIAAQMAATFYLWVMTRHKVPSLKWGTLK